MKGYFDMKMKRKLQLLTGTTTGTGTQIPKPKNTTTTTINNSYNIPKVGTFEKVSFDVFKNILNEIITESEETVEEMAQVLYDNIIIPHRMNDTNPFYSVYFPFGDTQIIPGQSLLIPSGIKVKLKPGWCLQCTVNPVLAISNDLSMYETISYVTPDRYDNPSDEGMIMFKVINNSKFGRDCVIKNNTRLCSCIFVPYGLSSNDMIEQPVDISDC